MVALLPEPRKIAYGQGLFTLNRDTVLAMDASGTENLLRAVKMVKEDIKRKLCYDLSIVKALEPLENAINFFEATAVLPPQGYLLNVTECHTSILANDEEGLLNGVQTTRQLIELCGASFPCLEMEDYPHFLNRGYMLDVTRGKTPTLEGLKLLADRLAYFKGNLLMLYVEHTFQYRGLMSEVLSKTDPLTAETILIFDAYCKSLGIELIPCMATVSHMYDILNTNSYQSLSEVPRENGLPFTWYHRLRYHMPDISNPESFALLCAMLDQYLPLFMSKRVNICCDEVFDLGKGRSRAKAEKTGVLQLYLDFINQVIAYIRQKHHKQIMMWADVPRMHPEQAALYDKEAVYINWGYYDSTKESTIQRLGDMGLRQYVCPSPCGFSRLVNAYQLATKNILDMVTYGVRYHAEGFLAAGWGDDGHVNMMCSDFPGMALGAALSWNPGSHFEGDLSDAPIGRLLYGDQQNQVMPRLRQLSRLDKMIWNDVAFWIDSYLHGVPAIDGMRAHADGCTFDELGQAYTDGKKLIAQLRGMMGTLDERCRGELNETLVTATGSPLMQAFFQYVKKYVYMQDPQGIPVVGCEALATQLEAWLYEYIAIWRKRAYDTELPRIREGIGAICDFLRKLENQ